MSKTKTIHAVDMVRRIRDEQAAKLARKSEAEVIEFFKRAGQAAQKAAQKTTQARSSGKGTSPRGV